MSAPYRWPCLYCGDTSRPRTSEHVLQAAFGGVLTLPDDVCGICNTEVLGPLDDRLADFVRRFVYWDSNEVPSISSPLQQGLKIFLADSGIWLSAWFGRGNELHVPPQAVFLPGGVIRFAGGKGYAERAIQLVGTIQDELKQPEHLQLSDDLWAPREPPIQPALVRTAARCYVLRAQDPAAIEQLRAEVTSGVLLVSIAQSNAPLATTVNPTVEGQVAIDFGRAERAVAKTALNFACVVLGPEAVRGDLFAPIRQFIVEPYPKETAGFVNFLFGASVPAEMPRIAEAMARPGLHSLLFVVPDGLPLVAVCLYGRPFAVVYLAKAARRSPGDAMASVLALFDFRAKTHEVIRMRDDPIRFGELFDIRP